MNIKQVVWRIILFSPLMAIFALMIWTPWLPPKEVVFSEALTESIYLILALYTIVHIRKLKSKLIFCRLEPFLFRAVFRFIG